MPLRGPNIKEKLVLMATVTSALSLLLVACIGYLYSRIDYRRELAEELLSDARFLAFNSAAAIEFDSPEEAGEGLRALQVHPNVLGAAIFNLDGELFATYLRGDAAESLFEGIPTAPGPHFLIDRIVVLERIQAGSETVGTICLVSDLSALHARVARNAFAGGLVFVAIALFSILVSIRLQRFISEPVHRLAETARSISESKDYGLRASVRSGDELGELARQFNYMLDQIQHQDRALREANERLEERVRDRTQALEAAKEEAEAASRAKGDFLATMSHELRTPLNGIAGMMELISDSDLTEEQRERVRVVNYSAESLVAIVNDILDFSKIEAGKLELDPRPFDLANVVHGVGELLSVSAAAKGVDLFTHISAAAPRHVVGDEIRVRQILTNLVGNAVKFTQRGHVRIGVDFEESGEDGLLYTFCVEDTGVGIDNSKLDSIFETFTQVDASTTRQYGGTGLGLAIARRLVETMGGAIRIESEAGKGSTVHFTLAFKRGVPASPRVPVHTTLLLLDDDPITRGALSEHLEQWGFAVTPAATGSASIACRVGSEPGRPPFEIILLHVTLSTNVAEVGRALRSQPMLAAVPLVAIGSPAHPRDPALLLESGIDRYLETYLRPSRVLDALMAQLPHKAAAASWVPKGKSAVEAAAPFIRRDCPYRILLVEDNLVNQKVALGFLKRLGLAVEIAGDGQRAVALCREQNFDLIFMDIQMPVMDGYEATAHIRRESSGGDVPIVAMTANAMDGDRERCLAAGMNDYLTKPLQGKLLHGMIAKYLGKGAVDLGQNWSFLIVGAADGAAAAIADAVLERWPGAHVQPFHTGVEACIRIGSRLPDCVIVDRDFRDLDVDTLAACIQADGRYAHVHLFVWDPDADPMPAPGSLPIIAGRGGLRDVGRILGGAHPPPELLAPAPRRDT